MTLNGAHQESEVIAAHRVNGQDENGLYSGYLFNPRGKWKYNVKLDYGDYVTYCQNPAGRAYMDPQQQAAAALRRATEAGVSGVTITSLKDYWILVVPDPPNGWPICILPHSLFLVGQNLP